MSHLSDSKWCSEMLIWSASTFIICMSFSSLMDSGCPCRLKELFLVPLIGGGWYIITQLAVIIYHLYIANWVIIYHLPPIKGTRKLHWKMTLVNVLILILLPLKKSINFWNIGDGFSIPTWMGESLWLYLETPYAFPYGNTGGLDPIAH